MTDDIQKFKIIFLGDQGVGKSSILNRFAQDKFEAEYKAKIEAYRNQTRIDGQWLRNVKAIDIDTMATYIVTVTYTNQETQEEMVIGTAKLIITNGKSSGGYILNIEKPPLFKYDANGSRGQ